jgi:hypothetical protein
VSRRSWVAEPAIYPGSHPARTMFTALYGELAPHPRPDGLAELSEDAYSLFDARSAAMGWLTPAVEGASGGLWGMNDAESTPGSGPQPFRVAFFQVVLTGPAPAGLLPVQPFLACANDVLGRLGTLRLEAIQVLLPERYAPADGLPASPSSRIAARPLIDSLNWFGDRDASLRVPVRVTLDAGADPSVRAAAPAIAESVQDINQDVFACDSFSLVEDDHLVLMPTALHGAPGTAQYRATFRGSLAEWSLDALGWLAAFLADVGSRHGIGTQLMLTADRSAEHSPRAS